MPGDCEITSALVSSRSPLIRWNCQESTWSRLPKFRCFHPAFACNKRGVFPATPRETTDCCHYYGSCCTADISTDGNSYVPAKPQLDTWTSHHGDNGRWVLSRAYFHFRAGRR